MRVCMLAMLFSDSWFHLVFFVSPRLQDELAIVAFPCNQFGAQEPGTWEEIASFADRQYGVTFPIMDKVSTEVDCVDSVYTGGDEIHHG